MRRARIQAKPNIGIRARNTGIAPAAASSLENSFTKSEPISASSVTKNKNDQSVEKQDVKTSLEILKSDELQMPAGKNTSESNERLIPEEGIITTAVQENPNSTSTENLEKITTGKVSALGAMRRSRIKPQVKVISKPRMAPTVSSDHVKSEAEKAEVATDIKDKENKSLPSERSIQVTSEKEVSDKRNQSKDTLINQETNSSLSMKVMPMQISASVSSSAKAGDSNKAGTGPPTKRGRFFKPRPNLIETGRKRGRHGSVSGASDTDEESHSSVIKRMPPPVQRHASLATMTPEKKQTEPEEISQQSDVASVNLHEHRNKDPPDKQPDNSAAAGTSSDTYTNIRADKHEKQTKPRMEFKKKVKENQLRKESRKTVLLQDPIDRSKMTISQLIYSNPMGNRMKSTIEEEERKKKALERQRQKDSDMSETGSIAGSIVSERRSNLGSPDGQSVASRRPSIGSPDRESLISECDIGGEEDKVEEELAPQLTIGPDGQIVVNEKSLYVANPDPDRTIEESEAIEEFGNAPYKPSLYYGRTAKTKAWGWRETKKFYLALSVIGSDFSMMSTVFPNRSRVDIKKKFKREEKVNRFLVEKALREPKTYDLSIFDDLSSSDDEETKKRKKKEEKEEKREKERLEKAAKVLEKEKKKSKLTKEKKEKEKEEKIQKEIQLMGKVLENTRKKFRKSRKNSKMVLFDTSSSESDVENRDENIPHQTKHSIHYKCDVCGIEYETEQLLKVHREKHDLAHQTQELKTFDDDLTRTDSPMAPDKPVNVSQSSLITSMKNSRQILYDDDSMVAATGANFLQSPNADIAAPVFHSTPDVHPQIGKDEDGSQQLLPPNVQTVTGQRIRTLSNSSGGKPAGAASKLIPTSDGSQIVFVSRFKPGEKEGIPGKKVVHMYMVSPPPVMPQSQSTESSSGHSTTVHGTSYLPQSQQLVCSSSGVQKPFHMQPISTTSQQQSFATPVCYIDPTDGSTKVIIDDKSADKSDDVSKITKELTEGATTGQPIISDLKSPPPRVVSITPLPRMTAGEAEGSTRIPGPDYSQIQMPVSPATSPLSTNQSNFTQMSTATNQSNSQAAFNPIGETIISQLQQQGIDRVDVNQSCNVSNAQEFLPLTNNSSMSSCNDSQILMPSPLDSVNNTTTVVSRPVHCINVLPQYPSPNPIFSVPKFTSTSAKTISKPACQPVVVNYDKGESSTAGGSAGVRTTEVVNVESLNSGTVSQPIQTKAGDSQTEHQIDLTGVTDVPDSKDTATSAVAGSGKDVRTIKIKIISSSSEDEHREEKKSESRDIGGATISADSGEIKVYME